MQVGLTLLLRILPRPWSDKPAYLAHHAISMAAVTFMAITGCSEWFGRMTRPSTAEGRFWDRHPAGDMLAHFMFTHMIAWDIPCRLIVPSLRDPTMLAHHAAAALVAYCGLHAGAQTSLTYYSTYFFGVTELSSVPLHVLTLFKPGQILHEHLNQSPLCAMVNQAARLSFSATFLALRAVHFPYVTVCYTLDCWHLLFVSTHAMTLSESVAMVVIALCNWALMGLQLYWARIIIRALARQLSGRSKSD